MELQTEAVGRVLEALSPALAAELERVIEETRQRLEAEFQNRMQTAVREAEEAARITAEGERQHAVDNAINETRTAVREQVARELETQFEQRLQESREEVRRQVSEELQRDFERRLQDVTDRAAVDQAAAELLSSRQQRILRLSFEGASVQEIADELHLPAERVSDEKYKAIKKLRQHLCAGENG